MIKRNEKVFSSAPEILNSAPHCKLWADMLADPATSTIQRSPALVPFLATASHLVYTEDISSADSLDDQHFLVVVKPQVSSPFNKLTAFTSSSAGASAIGSAHVTLKFRKGEQYATDGVYRVNNGGKVSVIPLPKCVTNSSTTNSVCLPGVFSSSTTVTYYMCAHTGEEVQQITPCFVSSTAAGTPITMVTQSVYNNVTMTSTGVVGSTGSRALLWRASAPQQDFTVNMIVTFSSPISIDLVSYTLYQYEPSPSQILDVEGLGASRVTAMSLLVSNMSSSLDNGGELVVGRVPLSILDKATPTLVMNAIKSLPETNYWRSGAIREGGYAWYLPSSGASYEPNRSDAPHPEEYVLVAVGKFASDSGLIRIKADIITEFYTTSQIFDREYGPIWDDNFSNTLAVLRTASAVSENPAHLALVSQISRGVGQALKFYQRNKQYIDPVAKAAAAYAMSKINSGGKGGDKTKQEKASGRQVVTQNNKHKSK